MLLLTCATHLLSVAVVRHYWRYPLLAGIRVAVITGVFVVTGLLLGNQNATNRIPFPSEVPPLKNPDSYLLMPAACFQASNSPFIRTFTTSFKDEEHAKKAFLEARPGNKIEGWNFYLLILFCYGAAILVEIGKKVVRINQRKQFFNMSQGLKSTFLSGKSGGLIRGLSRFAYGLYLAACVAISGVTIGFQVTQLFGLRRWARRSGWLETNEGGLSEEDDWSTFGQLVPMFLGLLTLFTFVENISRKFPAFACTNGSTDNITRNVQQTKQADGDRRVRRHRVQQRWGTETTVSAYSIDEFRSSKEQHIALSFLPASGSTSLEDEAAIFSADFQSEEQRGQRCAALGDTEQRLVHAIAADCLPFASFETATF
jgi:hypothetical protein